MNWVTSFLDLLLILSLLLISNHLNRNDYAWRIVKQTPKEGGTKIEYVVLKGQNFDLVLYRYVRGSR